MEMGCGSILMALLIVAFAGLPAPAFAWDYPGHRIVGAIADLVLQEHHPEVYREVQDRLAIKDASGNEVRRTLSQVAVFPDCAKPGIFRSAAGRPRTRRSPMPPTI